MFKYLILYALIALCGTWALPVQQHGGGGGDIASHVVIVTPQAQVHLEPAGKFGPFFHHLSPFARIAAPHEETIVYVPASAAGPVIPIDALAHHVGRSSAPSLSSSSGGDEFQLIGSGPQTKQDNTQIQQIQQAIQQGQAAAAAAQAAAQEGFGQLSSQFAEAAASLSPTNLFPQPQSAQNKEKDLGKFQPKESQLFPAAGRQYYVATGPVFPHIVDFVHTAPVLVSQVSTSRSRNLKEVPVVYVPLADEALSLKTVLKRGVKEGEGEKTTTTTDFGRFLEANAMKTDAKQEQEPEQQEQLDEQFKRDNLQLSEQKDQQASASEPEQAIPAQSELAAQPQLKSVLGAVGVAGVPAGNSVIEDVVPQSKVA